MTAAAEAGAVLFDALAVEFTAVADLAAKAALAAVALAGALVLVAA